MQIYKMKKGDTQPISIQVSDNDTDDVVDLTGATAKFIMVESANTRVAKVNSSAQVYDPTNGKVRYNFTPTNSDTPGEYYGYFEITYSGGKKQTIPPDDTLKIIITDDWE